MDHVGQATGAVVYGYWSGVEAEGYEWAYRDGAGAGLIPTNDGLTCVFAGSTPARVGRGGQQALEHIVRRAAPGIASRVAAGRAPAGVRSFRGQLAHLRRAWGAGWALAGDAGSWKDPISTHGLTNAFRDAELLARTIVSRVAGDIDDDEAMSAYQGTRDRLTLPLLHAADAVATYAWADDEIPALLMKLSASMADEVNAIVAFDAVTACGNR
jgi:2-polyprenyl-6-methoxyphenol hydroxylase-like FAD-dependent oxidoreductase